MGQKAQILRHKKTPAFQGPGLIAHSPHLADDSAGIGTLLEKDSSGLPGFTGPYPSTSLDETMLLHIFSCASTFADQHKLLLLLLYATDGLLVNVEFLPYLVNLDGCFKRDENSPPKLTRWQQSSEQLLFRCQTPRN